MKTNSPSASAPRAALSRLAPRAARALSARALIVLPPVLWLGLFLALPFLIVLKISFSEPALSQPPFLPLFTETGPGLLDVSLEARLENYWLLFTDTLYSEAYVTSVRIAVEATLLTLAIGFPLAYAIARAPSSVRLAFLFLVILPFWTSFLIRVYAWIGILKEEGILNGFLLAIGAVEAPLPILNTETAILIGIVYSYLPFMVLPLYAHLEKMENELIEAAMDLGCRPAKAFWSITVPLARPGILAGSLLVFIPAVGEFVIPDLLGGADTPMIGKTLWVEFFHNRDWPLASAIAVLSVLILTVPIVLWERQSLRRTEAQPLGGLAVARAPWRNPPRRTKRAKER
jgi:putrescine transport system permease protein